MLKPVEFAEEDPQRVRRVYPAGKTSAVVIDLHYNFRRSSIDGFSTEVLAELVEAGEPTEGRRRRLRAGGRSAAASARL